MLLALYLLVKLRMLWLSYGDLSYLLLQRFVFVKFYLPLLPRVSFLGCVADIFMWQIPGDLEVGYVPLSFGGAYPGLYLFTSPGRFVRPVRNISIHSEKSQNIELIGPFEQVIQNIQIHFLPHKSW
jgi:hypothetical protein